MQAAVVSVLLMAGACGNAVPERDLNPPAVIAPWRDTETTIRHAEHCHPDFSSVQSIDRWARDLARPAAGVYHGRLGRDGLNTGS